MKCDELEEEYLWTNNVKTPSTRMVRAYNADDVDKAIDELKDKIQMHDFFWEGCWFAKRRFKNTIAVSEAFDRLEAENAELKKKLMPCLNGDCILTCEVVEKYGKENAELKAEIESLKASHYAEMVDAGMRERRLTRALWIARGYIMTLLSRDFQRLAYQCNSDDYKKTLIRGRNQYYDLYEKCIKKAEEYK